MTAAVVRISWYGGSSAEPAGITAEDNAGIIFNREDSKAGNSVAAGIPIPLTVGTNYSWPKLLALEVTSTGTTSIQNRRISLVSPMPVGVHWFAQGAGSYAQPTSIGSDAPTDAAVPSGYMEISSVALWQWDNTSVSTAVLGRNGAFCQSVLGVDSSYAASGGSAGILTLPSYRLSYDEASAEVSYALLLALGTALLLGPLFFLGMW